MNAEQFYQEFKNSLSHLGVRWGDMAEVEVWVEDDTFYMMLDGKQTSLAVLLNSPKQEPTLKWCDKCGEGITNFCRAKGDDEPSPVRLLLGDGHSGHGLYLAAAEYPEEGALLLAKVAQPEPVEWPFTRPPVRSIAQPEPVELTDADCTRIYNEANGITDKNPPISTKFIFAAMRAAAKGGAV